MRPPKMDFLLAGVGGQERKDRPLFGGLTGQAHGFTQQPGALGSRPLRGQRQQLQITS